MNLPRAGLMDAVAEQSLAADVDSLLTLGAAPVAVSFATDTSTSTDMASGQVTRVTDTDSIDAFLSPLTDKQLGEVPGAKVGDAYLLFPKADVSSRPKVKSRATIGSALWVVQTVEEPPLTTHYRLRVRRHGAS